MAKSLEQLNREFMETVDLPDKDETETSFLPDKTETKPKKRKTIKFAAAILLFAAVVFVVATEIAFNANQKRGLNIFGYSGFTILSESMKSKIPAGSLVVTKEVDPEKINVGDDITFIRKKDDSFVTHRVISVYDNHGENGEKGFRTKGTDNSEPDHDIVYAEDVVGVVKFAIPGLGYVLDFISVNIGFFMMVLGGVILVTAFTKKLLLPAKRAI